jgi:hypothetical protein
VIHSERETKKHKSNPEEAEKSGVIKREVKCEKEG